MDEIEIIAFTPRAGKKGYRTITASDCKLTDDQIDIYIKNASENLTGIDYVSISKEVQQQHILGSTRFGNEQLIAISICKKKKRHHKYFNEKIKISLLELLESNYNKFVSTVIDSTNWEEEATNTLIINHNYIDNIKSQASSLIRQHSNPSINSYFILSFFNNRSKLSTFFIGFFLGIISMFIVNNVIYTPYKNDTQKALENYSQKINGNLTDLQTEKSIEPEHKKENSSSSSDTKMSLISKIIIFFTIIIVIIFFLLSKIFFFKNNKKNNN